ncbi:MAG: hypothetical protein ACK5WD_10455 [bacterium]
MSLARAELDAAQKTNDAARRTEVVSLLRRTADALMRAHPFGEATELEVRSLLLSVIASDERAAMEERIALGRVLVQLDRAPLGFELLSQAVRYFAQDQSRFRERLEASLWLARALDRLGSPDAALAMLDQPQLTEDARVHGVDTVLAKEVETTRAMLRARLKK